MIGSIAFARSNAKASIMTQEGFETLKAGLREIEKELEAGISTIVPGVEPTLFDGAIGCCHTDSPFLVTWKDYQERQQSLLGCGILAGKPLGIDSDMITKELGLYGFI